MHASPPDPIVVAEVYDPATGELYDRAWSWETGQTYAQNNYRVVAVADDDYMTTAEAQRIYDTERRWAQDCFDIDATTILP